MNSDGQLAIHWIVLFHLWIKGPFAECMDSGSRQLAMFAWF
jgi:hypothetical protein